MSGFDTVVHLVYLGAAVCFVLGLQRLTSPATARDGNRLSAGAMAVAVAATVAVLAHGHTITAAAVTVLAAGAVVGAGVGLVGARRVRMTAMPQLVSVFNAVGGGAAALIAFGDALGHSGSVALARQPVATTLTTALDLLIGGLTFAGSLVAGGKLAGIVPGQPISPPAGRVLTVLLAGTALTATVTYSTGRGGIALLCVLTGAALGLGVLTTLPIGGADMPVVISLLNAGTGTAVAMAGFVIDSTPLIIGGALVGAAGAVLTTLMARAMNRTLRHIVAGGFGTGAATAGTAAAAGGVPVREVTAEDAALSLAYARTVVIVPGFGLVAAQGQHELVELAQALTEHGVDVSYGIHPVAGRMPGHLNVLLAEANAPYEQLRDLEEINPHFPDTDVVLVVGANDVTNPAARRAGNAVSGMPILDVDRARSVIVLKRSLGHGYAGIDNDLYTNPKTALLFGDAKATLAALLAGLHAYV